MSRENPDFLIAANLAHEIQNPLQAILGLCETHLPMTDSPKSAEVLRKIQTCAEDLSVLVKDVLDFSQHQQNQHHSAQLPFDPVSVFYETITSLYPQAQHKGIELLGFSPANAPHEVIGDTVKFKRILLNLLQNAVKFTANGFVHAHLNFLPSSAGHLIQIKVKDTGIGIPRSRLKSIFQPFTQADATTFTRYGGTGLGLTMVQALARFMGGDVQVQSQPGRGSCFTVNLLVGSSPTVSTDSVKFLEGKKVFILSPCPYLNHWLNQCLRYWGAEVKYAADSWEAEKLGGEESFDFLIMDLPQDTAPQWPQLQSTSTILLSDFEYSLQGYRILPKPVNLQTLRGMLENKNPAPVVIHSPTVPTAIRPLRILVAEDNEVNREVVSLQLKRAGHEVSATVDGAAALELWRAKEFDLIILDLQMPLLGGIAIASVIRKEERRRKRKPISLVALTGSMNPAQRALCQKVGLDEFLVKPLRGADLLAKVNAIRQRNELPEDTHEFIKNLQRADAQEAEDLKFAGRIFLKHSDSFIEKLQTALANKDPQDMQFQAHAVLGMLGIMGCSELVQLASLIDRRPQDSQTEKRTKRLIDGLRKLKDSLRSLGDLTPDGQT